MIDLCQVWLLLMLVDGLLVIFFLVLLVDGLHLKWWLLLMVDAWHVRLMSILKGGLVGLIQMLIGGPQMLLILMDGLPK